MSNTSINILRQAVAQAMKSKVGTEVGDVEEIEPVGSTPVKTRTKERMQAMAERVANKMLARFE